MQLRCFGLQLALLALPGGSRRDWLAFLFLFWFSCGQFSFGYISCGVTEQLRIPPIEETLLSPSIPQSYIIPRDASFSRKTLHLIVFLFPVFFFYFFQFFFFLFFGIFLLFFSVLFLGIFQYFFVFFPVFFSVVFFTAGHRIISSLL